MRRSVIFDFDDTIIRSRTNRAQALIHAIKGFGGQANGQPLDQVWGKPFRDMVTAISPDLSQKMDEFIAYYANELTKNPPIATPGTLVAIPKLSEIAHLFIHTSSHSLLARTDLETLGILRYFTMVCGSDLYHAAKPARSTLRPIELLLKQFGGDLRSSIYVGDSLIDQKMATAAELQFIHVQFADSDEPASSVIDLDADHTISNMVEIEQLVRQLDAP